MDYVASEMALDLAKVRPALEARGIKFYGTLYLPPGEYGLRVLVRNATTGRAGVAATRLSVPVIPGGAPRVLPPLFPDTVDRLDHGAREPARRRADAGGGLSLRAGRRVVHPFRRAPPSGTARRLGSPSSRTTSEPRAGPPT